MTFRFSVGKSRSDCLERFLKELTEPKKQTNKQTRKKERKLKRKGAGRFPFDGQ